MASVTDVSLAGMKNFVLDRNKGGYSIIPTDGSLRELEQLLTNMNSIRDGTITEGCSCQGNELDGYNKVSCSAHQNIFNRNDLSLGQYKTVLEAMTKCTCDSVFIEGCACVGNCTCNCNSVCCVSDCCVSDCCVGQSTV